MIGIAFGYPSEAERQCYGVPNEVRFARIEVGEPFRSNNGRDIGPYYWRKWEVLNGEELMAEILEQVGQRPREISGFTLFYQSSTYTKADGTKTDGPGFQMSVRRKGEDSWDVRIIPEAEAMAVFRLLENTGHPDGPWKLKTDIRDSFIVPQSAVEGWSKSPIPDDGDVFEVSEDDLTSLLNDAGKVWKGVNASLATLIGVLP